MLQEKLRRGEKLTDDEILIVNEVRERIRKKDEPEVPVKGAAGKAGGKAPPPKAAAKDDKAKNAKANELLN
jgi:hypothetical protein